MQKDPYAASRNPPRHAKRSLSGGPEMSSATQRNHPRPIRPYAPRATTDVDVDVAAPSPPLFPAKRGRKPALLSRSAREAQRRLDHSNVEKARRTKINDAFATLKELVPSNYGRSEPPAQEADEEDDDDGEGEHQDVLKKAKLKRKAKKDKKEKDFKLEILDRTVVFLKDLLKRVSDLEASVSPTCHNCVSNGDPVNRKRKRQEVEDDADDEGDHRFAERPPNQSRATGESSPDPPVVSSVNVSKSASRSMPNPRADFRLPSISSWLPDPPVDPRLLPRPSPSLSSYLPSPPSSVPFNPVRSSQIPPAIHLGPCAPISPTIHRTTRDDNAASLLLPISTSPSVRPVSSSGPGYGHPTSYNSTSGPRETATQATNLKRPGPSWV